jgi:CheY-like chemotaxis protein
VANEKILVVDDEPDVVAMIERTLKAEGYIIVKAFDGIGALDLVASEKPDLILLDIMMPMMSGYEVCEQLKANPQTQHIPVVCLTSAHAANVRSQSQRVGAVTVVSKPFMPAELVAQIKRYLTTPESTS